ncbi:amino acid synthesis family protein [Inquilinus limosus]|uniref:Uncharacterized protein n=1 Tax=Inquilinus limosus TaxID=171674 RepID=A0A211ZV69_9PROT|nr:amino acid synthesis family protein [Inquilinus limosus]OWJ69188.1 hypothetical protein BWR60_01255 [Inquilinus limosus]
MAETLLVRLLALIAADQIEAYGKAAVAGLNDEVDHASAPIHTLHFGTVFCDAVGG